MKHATIAAALLAAGVIAGAITACQRPSVLIGPPIYTDAETGCQYYHSSSEGGVYPRLTRDGRPMCAGTTAPAP